MALQIPQIENPFDSNNPIVNAYGWIAGIALDRSNSTGRITLNVNPNAEAMGDAPIDQIFVDLDQVLVPSSSGVAEVRFSNLQDLMQDPTFADAFSKIAGILYNELVDKHPLLEGSTQI